MKVPLPLLLVRTSLTGQSLRMTGQRIGPGVRERRLLGPPVEVGVKSVVCARSLGRLKQRLGEAPRTAALREKTGRHSRHRERIELAANQFGFRRGIRKGDGTMQRIAGFIEPIELLKERATQPVQIEIRIQLAPQRFDHR